MKPAAQLPPITECENCGTHAAEVICHLCKQPRHAFQRFVAALLTPPLKRAA